MKQLIFILALCLSSLTFAQSTERVSLHLFDLPEGVSIEEFKADLNRANKISKKNGFGADRYKVYQVKADDKNDTYRYMWISTWSNDTEYEKSHSEEMATFWDEFFYPKYKAMLDAQIYRKFFATP